jgi:hypothetical protein
MKAIRPGVTGPASLPRLRCRDAQSYLMKRGRKDRMAVMAKKYSCKNCGSIFEPSLKAEFEHIEVRCSFCHYVAALVPIPEFETIEQHKDRTGEDWPDKAPVWVCVHEEWQLEEHWRALQLENDLIRLDKDFGDTHVPLLIICATEAGPPPDDWRLE